MPEITVPAFRTICSLFTVIRSDEEITVILRDAPRTWTWKVRPSDAAYADPDSDEWWPVHVLRDAVLRHVHQSQRFEVMKVFNRWGRMCFRDNKGTKSHPLYPRWAQIMVEAVESPGYIAEAIDTERQIVTGMF